MRSFTRKQQLALVAAAFGAVAFACGGGSGDNGSSSSGGTSTSSSGGSSTSSSGSSSTSSSSSSSGHTSSSSSSSSGSNGDGGTVKGAIFVVLFENHDYNEIIGSPNAPYFNSLADKYGLATNYFDAMTHPSLPNYLTIISGDPAACGLGCAFDVDPTFIGLPKDEPNLGSQMQTAGVKWRSYQQDMGTPCKLSGSGGYAPKHDPFLYFKDMQASPLCADTNVDYTQFVADLAAGSYRFSFITPNLTNDGHDPSNDPVAALKTSDDWAKAEIGKIIASPSYINGGTIFILWDEAQGRNGNSGDQIPMIVVNEKIKAFKTNTKYSHLSFLATLEDMMGLPRLATVQNEASMMEFFK
jgi:acid phosphatase